MVLLTEALLMAGTLLLVFNSLLPQPRVWVLFVCAALFAALNGLQRPSLDALMPRLVPAEQSPAAAALRSLGVTVSMIGGPALACLAAAGAADMVSGLFRSIIWNQTIPDHLRGRLAGVEMVSYTTGPPLGNAEAGLVAGLFGVRASIVSGGVLCVAGTALLSLMFPQLIRYDGAKVSGASAPKGMRAPEGKPPHETLTRPVYFARRARPPALGARRGAGRGRAR